MPLHSKKDPTTSAIERVAACLAESDPGRKCATLAKLRVSSNTLHTRSGQNLAPGRPPTPTLVHPRDLPRRALNTIQGHAAFVHAICHIEFTAINLALDAAVRFNDMPAAFYLDWVGVAAEEAVHFSLLEGHLRTLGYAYGDFDAHDGLWDMAKHTSDDVLRRMALVPRVMEARGLDVTPGMIVRLQKIGDEAGAKILERILDDEIAHVRLGSRWFTYLCNRRGLDPVSTFSEIVVAEFGAIRGTSLNREARISAGFTEAELEALSEASRTPKAR